MCIHVFQVINMSALLLMGAADAIGSSWLSVARIIRNRVESRVERAREERRSLGYIDTALVWLVYVINEYWNIFFHVLMVNFLIV